MFDVKGDALIRALSQRGGWTRTVTADDVEHGTKQRFVMEGRYGPSTAIRFRWLLPTSQRDRRPSCTTGRTRQAHKA